VTDQPPSEPPAPTVEPVPASAPTVEPALASAPTVEPAPEPTAEPGSSPIDAFTSLFPESRPEIAVGAAFGGGVLVALILKRLAR
jgi:hypothetical protein